MQGCRSRAAANYVEIYRHCENDPVVTARLLDALEAEGIVHNDELVPLRGSEDFGLFGDTAKSAMFFCSDREPPQLHNPDYDFPDSLIAIGARIFVRVVRYMLG